jgi:tetratricopeptide (TPR) repeat protein
MTGYRQACGRILDGLNKSQISGANHLALWACVVGPDASADLARAIALAEKAVRADPDSLQQLNTHGALLYRTGRLQDAVKVLERAHQQAQNPIANSSPAYTWYFLAMAHHRLGHHEDAATWLSKARDVTDKALTDHDAGKATLPWNRRLTLVLLRKEAETLIRQGQSAAQPLK